MDHINQGCAIFDAERRLVGWNQRLGDAAVAADGAVAAWGVRSTTLLGRLAREVQFGEGMTAQRLTDWVGWPAAGAPALTFESRRGDD
ncbi:MAG: PAS-domain containing protein [Gemmobacter sp.]|nr:PAS-domain containing protein [Gemmobacter sp.]